MRPAKILTLLLILCAFSATPALAANAGWPKSLTIGTASPGGLYLPYGQFLAKLWSQTLGIPVDAIATQGPVHNIKLLDLGAAQIGMTTMGIALQGWNGTGDWTKDKRYRNMRALFPMYDTPFQAVVLRRSNITMLQQLDKRCIEVGPRAGTGGTYVPNIMKLLRLTVQVKNGPLDDLSNQLLSGQCDADATMTGAPNPALRRAETKEPLTFLPITHEQISTVLQAVPELSPSTIPAKTYVSLTEDYDTFGVYNFAIVRADLPDDLVYQLTKVLFENLPALTHEIPTASDTIPKNVSKDTFLPLHPGAIRYYREIGISIPANLIP